MRVIYKLFCALLSIQPAALSWCFLKSECVFHKCGMECKERERERERERRAVSVLSSRRCVTQIRVCVLIGLDWKKLMGWECSSTLKYKPSFSSSVWWWWWKCVCVYTRVVSSLRGENFQSKIMHTLFMRANCLISVFEESECQKYEDSC